MKTNLKLTTLIISFVALIFSMNAQQKDLTDQLAGLTHFEEIMEKVNQHYEGIEKGERQLVDERPYKHWVRWAYNASKYVDERGDLQNAHAFIRRAMKQIGRADKQRQTTGAWTFMGPTSVNSSVGSAVGIGRVDRIVFHPSNSNSFYLCTPGAGLLRTIDGGASYTRLTEYLPSIAVSGMVISHDNTNKLFILTGDGDSNIGGFVVNAGYLQTTNGVYVSHDYGSTWSQTAPFPGNPTVGYALLQHPTNANILLAATNAGVYRTTDGGGSWSLVLSGLTYELKLSGGAGAFIYATQNGKVFRSVTAGATWVESTNFNISIPGGRIALATTEDDPSAVYLFSGAFTQDTACINMSTFGGIYKSTDFGLNFTRIFDSPVIPSSCPDGRRARSQSNYDLAIGVSHSNSDQFVTGAIWAWRRFKFGQFDFLTMSTPQHSGALGYVHADIHDVEYNPLNGWVYACTDGGLSVSTDDGLNWSDRSTGLNNSQIYHMEGPYANSNNFMIGLQDNGIIRKDVVGSPWDRVGGGDGFDISYDGNSSTSGYLTINKGVYRFTNNGSNLSNNLWPFDPWGNAGWFPRVETHNTDANIVLAGYADILRSSNGGTSWLNLGRAGNWDIESSPSSSKIFYAAGSNSGPFSNNGEMWRSDDTGISWSQISNKPGFPTQNIRITDIEVYPYNSSIVYAVFAGVVDGVKVLYSNDGGNSWINVSNNLPNVPINAIQVDNGNNAYVATDIGVFYKSNATNTWLPFFHLLPLAPITDLEIYPNSNIIRASTFGMGVWQSSLYGNCIQNITVASNLDGRRYFEVNNAINMSKIIFGGANTDITMKAGQSIILGNGFDTKKGNTFRAYIAPCGVIEEE